MKFSKKWLRKCAPALSITVSALCSSNSEHFRESSAAREIHGDASVVSRKPFGVRMALQLRKLSPAGALRAERRNVYLRNSHSRNGSENQIPSQQDARANLAASANPLRSSSGEADPPLRGERRTSNVQDSRGQRPRLQLITKRYHSLSPLETSEASASAAGAALDVAVV